MAFSLDPAGPISGGVRIVALEQIDDAIRWLSPPSDFNDGVHNARKCLKRLRSLLWLLRPGLPDPLFGSLQTKLRDIAHELAPARDAQAMANTIDKLGKRSPKFAGTETSTCLKAWLDGQIGAAESRARNDILSNAVSELAGLRATFGQLAVYPDSFAPLAAGLKQGYRDCRDAQKLAFKAKSDETFHSWRKAVQRHWRHIQLICLCSPDELKSRAEYVHTLAQLLGDDHDFANLKRLLAAPAMNFGRAKERAAIDKNCRKQQKALRREAKSLGRRLFADRPKTFAARMEQRWQQAAEARRPRTMPPSFSDMNGAPPAEASTSPQRQQHEASDSRSNIVRFGAHPPPEWKTG